MVFDIVNGSMKDDLSCNAFPAEENLRSGSAKVAGIQRIIRTSCAAARKETVLCLHQVRKLSPPLLLSELSGNFT